MRAAANELGRGLLGTDRHDCGALRMKSKTNSSADAPVGYNTPDMFPVFRDCVDPSLIPASDGCEAARGGSVVRFCSLKKKSNCTRSCPPPANAPILMAFWGKLRTKRNLRPDTADVSALVSTAVLKWQSPPRNPNKP